MKKYTRETFMAYVVSSNPALASALDVERFGRARLVVRSADDHAMHAIEMIATRADLKFTAWHNRDGQGRLGAELSGFTR